MKRTGKGALAPLVLHLYVAGDSPNSALARVNLHAAIAHLDAGQVTLHVVDVLRTPEKGLALGILVTPTLVRIAPLPEKRVIGNLREREVLLAVLGLPEVIDA